MDFLKTTQLHYSFPHGLPSDLDFLGAANAGNRSGKGFTKPKNANLKGCFLCAQAIATASFKPWQQSQPGIYFLNICPFLGTIYRRSATVFLGTEFLVALDKNCVPVLQGWDCELDPVGVLVAVGFEWDRMEFSAIYVRRGPTNRLNFPW